MTARQVLAALIALLFLAVSCTSEEPEEMISCVTSFDCPIGWACEDDWCVEFPDTAPSDKDTTDIAKPDDDGAVDTDEPTEQEPEPDDADAADTDTADTDTPPIDTDNTPGDQDGLASDDDSLLTEEDRPDDDIVPAENDTPADIDTPAVDDAAPPDTDTAVPDDDTPLPYCGSGYDAAPQGGLMMRLRMDEGSGSIVYDGSGNNNTGTAVGTSWGPGRMGNALFFSGGTNTVAVPNSASLQVSQMTLAAWLYIPSSVTNRRFIMGKGTAKNLNYGFWLETDDMAAGPVGHLMFHFDYDDQNVGAGVHTPLAYNDNQWHLVVGTYDGTDLKIYVDGALVATKNYPGLTPDVTADSFVIGRLNANYPYFNGYTDEVLLYNRALGAAEIAAIYNNLYKACDDGGNGDGDGCTDFCTVESGYVCYGFPSTCSWPCTHSVNVCDSAHDYYDSEYGDYSYYSWAGTYLQVTAAGAWRWTSPLFNTYQWTSYSSGAKCWGTWYNYSFLNGQAIDATYTAKGSYNPHQCYFQIKDAAGGGGNVVVTTAATGSGQWPANHSYTGTCVKP